MAVKHIKTSSDQTQTHSPSVGLSETIFSPVKSYPPCLHHHLPLLSPTISQCHLSSLCPDTPPLLSSPPVMSQISQGLLVFQWLSSLSSPLKRFLPTFTYHAFLQQSAVLQRNPIQLLLQFVDLQFSADPLHLPVVLRAVQALHYWAHTHTCAHIQNAIELRVFVDKRCRQNLQHCCLLTHGDLNICDIDELTQLNGTLQYTVQRTKYSATTKIHI